MRMPLCDRISISLDILTFLPALINPNDLFLDSSLVYMDGYGGLTAYHTANRTFNSILDNSTFVSYLN